MFSAYTEKSISSRDNLLNQNKLRVSRKIFICSSIQLLPIRPDPGQLLRASFGSTGFFVLKAQDVSLLLGLLQTEACPFFPKTSHIKMKGGLCRVPGDTLPPLDPFKNLSGQTSFASNTIWFVFIDADRDRDRNCPWFQTLLCRRPVFKDLRKTLLLPCQLSDLKNDQSDFFFSKQYFFKHREFSPITHCNVFWQERGHIIRDRLSQVWFYRFLVCFFFFLNPFSDRQIYGKSILVAARVILPYFS